MDDERPPDNGICDDTPAADAAGDGVREGDPRARAVEAAISEKSRLTIQNILDQVKTLSKIEKLLLYLKLPTEHTNSIDPLRQPLNPLGSRAEIHRTISWIKTHLEEDPEISLPKQDVYDEYSSYCHENKMKPLSQADFGKVMKQVYPKVRARRLGTRGNSRYCYSGLQRRHKLETPTLPDLSDKPLSTEPYCTQSDLMAAAWLIVKEWSEHQLGAQFPSLHALACYLVLNLSVSSGSAAAALVTTIAGSQLKDEQPSAAFGSSKHREMQLQLQKKLQQKTEVNRDHKRKIQQQSSRSESRSRCKRSKTQQPHTVGGSQPTSSSTSPVALDHAKNDETNNTSPSQGNQSVCDKPLDYTNLRALPDFSSFQKPAACEGSATYEGTDKVPIPRIGKCSAVVATSPEKTEKCSTKYKCILPKPELCDIVAYNPQTAPAAASVETGSQDERKKQKRKKTSTGPGEYTKGPATTEDNSVPMMSNNQQHFTRERLASVGSVDKDAMDEYLGTNNSQEHEEELLKYFKNNNLDEGERTKLSQLRQLLEQNGIAAEMSIQKSEVSIKKPAIKAEVRSQNLLYSGTRRRVSFETPLQEEAVPASPNTRRKNFSFTPISPGPLSPGGGRQSKCSSTNASPFVSPRNTPVPRVRVATHQGSGLSYTNAQLNPTPTINPVPVVRKQLPVGGSKPSAGTRRELELTLDKGNFTTAMSAPPSPMLPGKSSTNLLQKLLNSQDRVPYAPDYGRATRADPLSGEISRLFGNDVQQQQVVTADPSYHRSQSAPLHPNLMAALANQNNAYFSQFTFDLAADADPDNSFADLDALTETEGINVNKIINALEETTVAAVVGDNGEDAFGGMDVALAGQGFVDLKFNPSRSVPSTPLPMAKSTGEKGLGSRSYPSTPLLATETFNYLLDAAQAQAVKEESATSALDAVQGSLDNLGMLPDTDVLYNNMEFYTINDVNGDVLDKQGFPFDGQLVDTTGKTGSDVLGDHCMIVEGEQSFDEGLGGS